MIDGVTTDDITPCAALVTAFARDTDWIPNLHSPAQDHGFMTRLFDRADMSVDRIDGQVAGFVALDDDRVTLLIVHESARRQGVATRLIEHAMQRHDRLDLWCFVANDPARRLYECHGFQEVERTDGSGNDENLPDIRYEWRRR